MASLGTKWRKTLHKPKSTEFPHGSGVLKYVYEINLASRHFEAYEVSGLAEIINVVGKNLHYSGSMSCLRR